MTIAEEVVTRLLASRQLVVLTGAGMSAESIIATFRDKQTGLWAQLGPSTLASPKAWRQDKDLLWAWYEHRRANVLQTLQQHT